MTLTTKLPLLMVFVLLISFNMIPPSECTTGPARLSNKDSTLELHNRKFLQMLSDLKNHKKIVSDKYQDMVERELRTIPSGPDPLHDYGGGPKKPQTP